VAARVKTLGSGSLRAVPLTPFCGLARWLVGSLAARPVWVRVLEGARTLDGRVGLGLGLGLGFGHLDGRRRLLGSRRHRDGCCARERE
jgi:hypothetical protein